VFCFHLSQPTPPTQPHPTPPHPQNRNRPQTVASDLSPFYLSQARDNVTYWKRQRAPNADLGAGPERSGTTFMQCAAEAIPAEDESLDVVSWGWGCFCTGCKGGVWVVFVSGGDGRVSVWRTGALAVHWVVLYWVVLYCSRKKRRRCCRSVLFSSLQLIT